MLTMEKTVQSKEFQLLTKGLRTIFTIIMVLMIFGMALMAVILVGAMIVSENDVNGWLAKASVTASIHFEGLEMLLSEQTFQDMHYSKIDVVKLLLTATIYITILLLMVVQVRNILSNLSKGIIFSLDNSKKIERIAYCVIVLSVTVNAFRTYIVYLMMQTFKLESLFVKTDFITGISYHFTGINWTLLLCGLVIWTIARIFRYGAFLQDEYDATA
ncbi:DUF2975 domain-containing protein [Lysinibacillus fusiformis]|uniref:DUF2975 domain-containing protein n=2 Tax=Lysinibacillus fusiformis TaxID=28031 RepID=UPI0021B64327|nr:DUF2975 domain-containing protein [Lysinibacillus fusiformis]